MAWEILGAGISVAISVIIAVAIAVWSQRSVAKMLAKTEEDIAKMLGEAVYRVFHSKEIEIPETKEKKSLAEIVANGYFKLSVLFEQIIKPEGKSSGESEKEEEIRARDSFSLWSVVTIRSKAEILLVFTTTLF